MRLRGQQPVKRVAMRIYFNSATLLVTDRLLLLERAPGTMKLLVADLTEATNLVDKPQQSEMDLAAEDTAAGRGYAALGIRPAALTEVFTSDDTPALIKSPPAGAVAPDKIEGLAVINRATVAIANDNDFGIANPNDRSRIWVVRLKAPLPM
jgi:Esterase-like activity of phytase